MLVVLCTHAATATAYVPSTDPTRGLHGGPGRPGGAAAAAAAAGYGFGAAVLGQEGLSRDGHVLG